MDEIRRRLAQLQQRWNSLSTQMRIAWMVGGALTVVILGLASSYATRTNYEVLYANLSQEDAARVVERLRAMNVTFELENGGQTIRVPEAQVHETRLTLASEGLPNGGSVGFELFDQQRFGESNFSQRVQYRRALEGELSRTITHLAGVRSARVHLVLPERSLFANGERNASASVALQVNPGWRMRPEQVEGVSHLVASSVPNLTPDNVTVLDGEGRPLTGTGQDDDDNLTTAAARAQHEIEENKRRAVQALLDESLGRGVAVVRVSADVIMAQEEQVDETYDPERVATRSEEITFERADDGEGQQGVPGAPANLPGGDAADNPIDAFDNAQRGSERRNFEITKSVRRAVHGVGRIRRLSIAVVVDHKNYTGEVPNRTGEPRNDEELQQITDLVSRAAGIDTERGDQISVQNVPFASSVMGPPSNEVSFIYEVQPFLPSILGFVALVAFIVLIVMYLRRQQAHSSDQRAQELGSPSRMVEFPSGGGDPALAADRMEASAAGQLADYEHMRALTLEVARRDPELAARVISGWLTEDAAGSDVEAA